MMGAANMNILRGLDEPVGKGARQFKVSILACFDSSCCVAPAPCFFCVPRQIMWAPPKRRGGKKGREGGWSQAWRLAMKLVHSHKTISQYPSNLYSNVLIMP